jgi:hypothetical protein
MNSKFGHLTSLLGNQDIKGALFDPNKVKKSKQTRYRELMKGINIYSHSTSERYITCERKYCCNKLEQNRPYAENDIVTMESNIDFAFGRAVETGVQAAMLNHPKHRIFWDMFRAWEMNLMQQHPKNYAKTFTDSVIAIDQFLYIKQQLMQGWVIAMFNGKPAIELAFLVDLENGYYYVGHVDIILYHPTQKKYKVLEIKTTGTKTLHPAMYKNSGQATGYSIVLDQIANDVELAATFEVLYLVYPIHTGIWVPYEFTKSRSNRADWINTLLLDMQRINTSRTVKFWPKRGSSCFDFYRPCEYLDRCDLDPSSFNQSGDFAVVTESDLEKHEFDFHFKLSDILATQRELVK